MTSPGVKRFALAATIVPVKLKPAQDVVIEMPDPLEPGGVAMNSTGCRYEASDQTCRTPSGPSSLVIPNAAADVEILSWYATKEPCGPLPERFQFERSSPRSSLSSAPSRMDW